MNPDMHAQRIALVRARLQALAPTHLEVLDESHLHVGHVASEGGASHLRVIISTPQFESLSSVQRHRLVYAQLSDLMPFPIHALALVTNPISSKGTS